MTSLREATSITEWFPEIPGQFDGQLSIALPDNFTVTERWWAWLIEAHRHARVELTADRELRVAMVSSEGSRITVQLAFQLELWIRAGGAGMGLESAGGYDLPRGMRKYPDGSWVSPERLPDLPRPWRENVDLIPDLVFEIRSPSQSVRQQQEKMVEWIEGGVQLGWLIDPFERRVWIYRANGEVEQRNDPSELSGEDVCVGLVIDLAQVWE